MVRGEWRYAFQGGYGYTLQGRGITRWRVLEDGDTTRREVPNVVGIFHASWRVTGTSTRTIPWNYTIRGQLCSLYDMNVAKTTP
jgi:hypothetical protein